MKKDYLIFQIFFFCILSLCATAQSQKVDSLKKELIVSTESDRYGTLYELAYELYDTDNQQAVTYAKDAHGYALKGGDTLAIVKSGCILGQLLRRVDKVEESIKVLSKVLLISKRHDFEKEIIIILNALALSYTYRAQYDKALDYHFQSLVIREKEGDKKQISISLNNIGTVYISLGNPDLALAYFMRALKAKTEVKDTFDLNTLLANIGLCHSELKDYKMAQIYFDKSIQGCAPSCNNQLIIQREFGLGSAMLNQKNYGLADLHFNKSLGLSVKENNQRFQFENLLSLLEISIIKKDLAMGREYQQQLEYIPDRNQYRESFIRYYRLNADFYSQSKDYKKANLFRKKYSELRDSVFDAEKFKNISKVQMQYAERENLANIESQSKIISLQTEAIFRQRLLNLAIGAVALLIVGLVIILYKINRQKQKINEILDLRVTERTAELEKNRDELKHSHDEQAVVLKKVTSDLTSSLATIKGLSNTATKDLPQEQAIYFKEAEATTERLVNYVNKYSTPESI